MAKYLYFNNLDELGLKDNETITGQFEPGEKIILSCNINKHNKHDAVQGRALLITNRYIYNLDLQSMIPYLLSFVRPKSIIKRKISITRISGITVSSYYLSNQFVIHVAQEYDYRYSGVSLKRELILKTICQQYRESLGAKLPFYIRREPDLREFQTTDDDLKAGINKKPVEEPLLLSDEELQLGLDYFMKSKVANHMLRNTNSIPDSTSSNDITFGSYPEKHIPSENHRTEEMVLDKSTNKKYFEDEEGKEWDPNSPYTAHFQEPEAQKHTKLDFSSTFKFKESEKSEEDTNAGFRASEHGTRKTQQSQIQHNQFQQDNYCTNPKGYPAPRLNSKKY